MKVAVVGTGISGSLVARRLHAAGHDLEVFEAGARIGGHTATVDVEVGGRRVAVDTGFIVFNERTYPTFCALLRELGVAAADSNMSFSARIDPAGIEYNGTSIDALFAQRSNLLRPRFWSMVRGILRFYREAPALIGGAGGIDDPSLTLGAYLTQAGYSDAFARWHLLPMAAAVWSGGDEDVRRFPMRTLVRFFQNHGFLQVEGRPQWLTIPGGSRTYLDALVAPFRERIHTDSPVLRVARCDAGVDLTARRGPGGEAVTERFDRVVLSCHSDQALALLAEPTRAERDVLGAIRYQPNDVVLHTDARVMPQRKRAWAAWNVRVDEGQGQRQAPSDAPVQVTYWMNQLQPLGEGAPDLFVSLNCTDLIDPARTLFRATYDHPIFDPAAVMAQRRFNEIDGVGGVHYAGAYWRYGFHEDGAWSAHRAVTRLGVALPNTPVATP
ncbi:MAG: FAD-dependent oxidoreductase [Planctomycetota bacterium]